MVRASNFQTAPCFRTPDTNISFSNRFGFFGNVISDKNKKPETTVRSGVSGLCQFSCENVYYLYVSFTSHSNSKQRKHLISTYPNIFLHLPKRIYKFEL